MNWLRVAVCLLPGFATADPVLPKPSPFSLDLTWTAALLPLPSLGLDAPEPAPLLSFDDEPNLLLSLAQPSPGLQFTLDPDGEELFLGWQFEF